MWYEILPQIINMSITGGIIILAVLLIRLLLKRAPKVFSYALWAVVLFRLLCPASLSSSISIFNLFDAPITNSGSLEYIPEDIVHNENPTVNLLIADVNESVNNALLQRQEQVVADSLELPVSAATYIWLFVVTALLLYSVIVLFRLRRKLIGSCLLRDNIYLTDHIASPFVIGLFRPRIYLPSTLSDRERDYIILHEQHHIRRLDHIVKILAFLALCVHWFNPLVWIAFLLSSADMEMSCDEAVMKSLSGHFREDYSRSLLSLATGRRLIAGTPLAFGEGNTRDRIKNILNYKKPAFWVITGAGVACIAVLVCLLTNPPPYVPGNHPSDEGSLDIVPATEALLAQYPDYKEVNAAVNAQGQKFLLTTDATIKDLNLFYIVWDEKTQKAVASVSSSIYKINEMTPNTPLVVSISFSSGFPTVGVSYVDGSGELRIFHIIKNDIFKNDEVESVLLINGYPEISADTPLALISNGIVIVPYQQFRWSKSWDAGGWLAADAISVAHTLPGIAQELPVITRSNNLDFIYGNNVSFYYLSVYNESCERIYHNDTLSRISALPTGTYYVGIVVAVQGKYISAGKGYEVTGYECVFKLVVK